MKTLSDKKVCVNKRTNNWHYKEPDVKQSVKNILKGEKSESCLCCKDWIAIIKNEFGDTLIDDKEVR